MEAASQAELIATLEAQAEERRRQIADLERQLLAARVAEAYINGQLAILRQITLEPRPILREGGDDS